MAGKQNGETFVKFVKVHPQISVSDADATDDTGVLEQTIEETDQAKRKNVRFSTLRPTSTELGGTHGEPVNNLHGWRSPHDAPQAHRRQSFDNPAPNFPGSRSHVSWSSTPGSSHALLDVGGSERHRRASIISQIDDIFSTQPLGEVSGVRRKSSVRDDKPFLSRFNQSLQEFKRIEIAKTEVRRSLSRVSTILCGLAIIAVCLMVVDLEYYNIKTRDLQEFFPNTTSTVPVSGLGKKY
ncbi:uncharacterized protein [Ptychodera flava]|uniref:uncharacterized protein n=1 Tax=Ptychodera flava TaxID=63121 RepID=UPI00396A2675